MPMRLMYHLDQVYADLDHIFAGFYGEYSLDNRPTAPRDQVFRNDDERHVEVYWDRDLNFYNLRVAKSLWLIVHPTANLQRERNTFRAAQLWKVIRVSDLLTLIGTFYSAGITVERPVEE